MNKYIILTKVLLKNGSNSLNGNKKNKTKMLALWFIIALAFIPTIIFLIEFVSKAYDMLFTIGQEGLILAIGISFLSVFIFFLGIFYSQNVLYFANDIEILLPLPFKQSHILGAKFTIALFYEYLTEAVFLLPLVIVYGVKSNGAFLYYLYGLILLLVLPIIPLSVASFIIMILMTFTNVGRHKDKLKILGGIGAMFLGILFNLWMQKIGISMNNPQKMLEMMQSGNNSLLTVSNKLFPGTSVAAKALILSNDIQGFINLLMFLGIAILVIFVFLALGEKLYFKGVIGISESTSKGKEMTSKELKKSVIKNSQIIALTAKELKILFRTPIYFINCILMNFLWPVFILIPLFTQPEMMNNIRAISTFAKDPNLAGLIIGVSLASSLFLSSSNGITSTSISREGKNLFICKYIPVSYATQLTAKLLSGIIMSTISMIVMIFVAILLIRPPIYLPIAILILSLPTIIFISIVGILIDLNFPKLNWDNEVKAVKQNFNVFITLLFGVILAAAIVFIVLNFKNYAFTVSILLSLILAVIDLILFKFTMIKGTKIIANIEN